MLIASSQQPLRYTASLIFVIFQDHMLPSTGVDKGEPRAGQKRKEGGICYQMCNMYTCIAYLIEIRQFCSKNLVHKGVNFEAQNAL